MGHKENMIAAIEGLKQQKKILLGCKQVPMVCAAISKIDGAIFYLEENITARPAV
jgi:hypothetical protein